MGRERKPQDWAWQMCQQKPARVLLIKHNEAWDHKIFRLIPGSHGGGVDQLAWQRRKVYRGYPEAVWELGQAQVEGGGNSTQASGPGPGWAWGFLTGLPSSLERGRNQRLFSQKWSTPAGDLVQATGPSGPQFPRT